MDVTYFYRVRGRDVPRREPVSGLAIFDKRVMLFGSQASVKMFASDGGGCAPCEEGRRSVWSNRSSPIALHMKLVDCTASGETDPEPATPIPAGDPRCDGLRRSRSPAAARSCS